MRYRVHLQLESACKNLDVRRCLVFSSCLFIYYYYYYFLYNTRILVVPQLDRKPLNDLCASYHDDRATPIDRGGNSSIGCTRT